MPCDSTKTLQLWSAHDFAFGKMKTAHGNGFCMENIQRERKLRMVFCKGEGTTVFVYDGFRQSLLWLKNQIDLHRWGLRVVAAGWSFVGEDGVVGRNLYMTRSKPGIEEQKFDFVYPRI